MKLKLTPEQQEAIVFEDGFMEGDSDDKPTFKIIEEGDWISEGKDQDQEIIFMYKDKYYSFSHVRSSSPFADWFYDVREYPSESEAVEVKKVEKVIEVWVVVKD